MKFTNFMNGCGGKILTIILSIILGVILTLGGIAGAGYYVLTKKGMLLRAEELAVSKGVAVDFDDTVANGTVLDWGKSLLTLLKDTSNSTIGSIESLIGMSIISNTLNQMLGVEASILKGATISNIGETISSNLTMSIAKEKFEITFPDMPIFQDEEFLAKPIGQAFGSFDDYTLGEVINIEETAHGALKALRDVKINEIGAASTKEKINQLSLCELMTIDNNSSSTLKALKYTTIDSTYVIDENTQLPAVDENGRFVYQMKTLHIDNDDIQVEIQGISDKMKELKVSDTITITAQSNAVLRKMRLATVEEIYIKDYINELYQTVYPNAFDAIIISDYGGVDQTTVNAMPLAQKAGYLFNFISKTANRANNTYCKSYNALVSELIENSGNYIQNYINDLYKTAYPAAFDAIIISDYNGVDQATVNAMPLSQKAGYLLDFISKVANRNNNTYCRSYNELKTEESEKSLACGFGAEDMPIEQLGGVKFNEIIDNTAIGEIITITETSEPILKAFRYTKIKEMNSRIQTLRLDEIFAPASLTTGAMSLIDPSTTLAGIPSAITDSVRDSTIATLKGKGIINANIDSVTLQKRKSFIYNSSVDGFLSGVISFIEDPIGNINAIRFANNDLTASTSFASLTDFVSAYSQHEYVSFDLNVEITVDTNPASDDYQNFYNEDLDCFLIPVFSLETDTTFDFNDGTDPVNVRLAVYNREGDPGSYTYQLVRHQYAYFYAPDGYALDYINTITYQIKS